MNRHIAKQTANRKTDKQLHELMSETNRQANRQANKQGKGAGAWLDSIPTSTKFALNAADFCLASCLRLGCNMPLAAALDSCECGQLLDSKGYHLLTCKHKGGPIWTHGSIVNMWANCLSNLHITHKTKPRDLYDGNHCRPDIVYSTLNLTPTLNWIFRLPILGMVTSYRSLPRKMVQLQLEESSRK